MNVRRPGQGRPRVATAIQERYLRVSSLRQRFATARLLQNQLEQTHGVQINTQTIRNRLREYDLRLQEYLEKVEVSRMEWRARSPDLNPIEQVWDNLNRRLGSSENYPATLNDLGIQLIEIWEGLDQNILRSLILSMNRRCRAVINARGGNTKYQITCQHSSILKIVYLSSFT